MNIDNSPYPYATKNVAKCIKILRKEKDILEEIWKKTPYNEYRLKMLSDAIYILTYYVWLYKIFFFKLINMNGEVEGD